MSRSYRQLRWLAVLFTIAAAVATLIVILIAAFDFDIHWTNQDWSAAGTVVGALMTFGAVAVALSQSGQTQRQVARDQQAVRDREELAAVEAIARTATAFSTKVDAVAEEFLQQEQHGELTVEAHARENGPDAEATVAEIRASFTEAQRIIQRRQEVVLAAQEAQTTIALAIMRTHAPIVHLRSKLVLSKVAATAERLETPTGEADWKGVQRLVPDVSSQVALLLTDYSALQGLELEVKVTTAKATSDAD